jgi:hypothetical protein
METAGPCLWSKQPGQPADQDANGKIAEKTKSSIALSTPGASLRDNRKKSGLGSLEDKLETIIAQKSLGTWLHLRSQAGEAMAS